MKKERELKPFQVKLQEKVELVQMHKVAMRSYGSIHTHF